MGLGRFLGGLGSWIWLVVVALFFWGLGLGVSASASADVFRSTLVRTTDMAAPSFSPPSPDPSGLAYLPASNTLLMSDGEVEEIVGGLSHFEGVNIWEMVLRGDVVATANVSRVDPTLVPMTNEPTGVAFNSVSGHYFFTDDNADEVYDLDPGGDGVRGTVDDRWVHFDTRSIGSTDPEGIAYDSWSDHLFVADGDGTEIYEFTTDGHLVNSFDVGVYGVRDPESVEFNSESGTLLVLSSDGESPLMIETTTNGTLLRSIDVSEPRGLSNAGLAYAHASNGSDVKRYYIVDRGVDNDKFPNVIDGKMYEMTAPPPLFSDNQRPSVSAGLGKTVTLDLPASTSLDGTVVDDGSPNPPGSVNTHWSVISGPGPVVFVDSGSVDTVATFSVAGTYLLRLVASDGELTVGDDVVIEVNDTESSDTDVAQTEDLTLSKSQATVSLSTGSQSVDRDDRLDVSVKVRKRHLISRGRLRVMTSCSEHCQLVVKAVVKSGGRVLQRFADARRVRRSKKSRSIFLNVRKRTVARIKTLRSRDKNVTFKLTIKAKTDSQSRLVRKSVPIRNLSWMIR